jgi:hypothetical protein
MRVVEQKVTRQWDTVTLYFGCSYGVFIVCSLSHRVSVFISYFYYFFYVFFIYCFSCTQIFFILCLMSTSVIFTSPACTLQNTWLLHYKVHSIKDFQQYNHGLF